MILITPEQCRAARGLLKWGQDDLAERASVGVVSIRQFENVKAEPRRATLAALCHAFEAAGVEFIERGVRLKEGFSSVSAKTGD